MGFFDGGLQAMGGAIFGSYFRDGQLHQPARDSVGRILQPVSYTNYPIKVQVDSFGLVQAAKAGIPDKAVRVLILQSGLPVKPTSDDEISAPDRTTNVMKRYRLSKGNADPANIGWDFQAVPAGGTS